MHVKPPANFRKQIIMIAVIFLTAFTLRMVYTVQISKAPYFDNPAGDSRVFYNQSQEILSGDVIGTDIPFYSSPLYPYFIAFAFLIFGKQFFILRLIQIVIGSLHCILIYLLAKKISKGNVLSAVLAGLFVAGYGLLIFFDADLLMIFLTVVFVDLGFLLLVDVHKTRNMYRVVVAGICFGLAAMDRTNILLFIPVAAWFIAGQFQFDRKIWKWKPAIVFIGSVFAVILPFTVRNYIVDQDLVLISSNAGVNLYIGNNPYAKGVFHLPSQSGLSNNDLYGTSVKIAQQETGRTLKDSEVSSFWANKAWVFISSEPLAAVRIVWQKFLRFWNAYEVPNNLDFYFVRSQIAPVLRLSFIGFWLIAPIAVAGIVWRCLRKLTIQDKLLIAFVITYLLSVLPFFVTERYRLPVIPILLVYAAITVVEFFKSIRLKNVRAAVILTLGIVVAGVFVNWSRPRFNYARMRTIIGVRYLERALAEPRKYANDVKKAIRELKWAAELAPMDIYVRYQLGKAYATIGYYSGSLAELEKILQIDPHRASAQHAMEITWVQYEKKGDQISTQEIPVTPFENALVYQRLGAYEKAIKTYQYVLDQDPYHFQAYHYLGLLFREKGDLHKALAVLKKGAGIIPDNVILLYDLGGIYYVLGQESKARVLWTKCLELEPNNDSVLNAMKLLKK